MSPHAVRQANEWIVRLRDEASQPADFAAFETWLAVHPDHRAAYSQAEATVARIGRLGGSLGKHVEARVAARRRRQYSAGLAGAAVLAAGLYFGPAAFGPPSYDSAVGEHRTIALNDGSRVELNTNTRLVVRFDKDERRIELVRGEALFDVAHDTARPFIVEADGRTVRAVGTKFTVRADPGALSVMVVEGVVAVSSPAAPGGAQAAQPPLLKAGQQLDLADGRPALTAVPAAEIERNLSWRTGWLEFKGQPLSVAASEVTRYTGVRFVIDDPGLSAMPVWAYFRADDIDGFLAGLEQNGPSIFVERMNGDVRLGRRAAPASVAPAN
jgi:transmembrane sensor